MRLPLSLSAALLLSCTGSLVDPASRAKPGPVKPGDPAALTCTTPSVGPSPLRRLTHFEYDNTVRDLLGDTSAPARAFPPDQKVGLFDNSALTQTISTSLGEKYQDAAESLATAATQNLPTLLACDTAARGESTCAQDFISRFGRRAYRRPLRPEELTRLLAQYTQLRSGHDFSTAIRGVMQALLTSPSFLFRPEFGAGPGAFEGTVRLGHYEMASRLSYLLWGSMPDDGLLAAAEAGELGTRAQVELQARRMLADDKARPAIQAFYEQWFRLDRVAFMSKDPAVYPGVDDALKADMLAESRTFIAHVLWEDDGKLQTLFTASYSYLNGPLAALYGISGVTGNELRRVALDPTQRSGILTQVSLLSALAKPNQSSPIKRGEFLRTAMLCRDLPPPPPGVPELGPIQPGLTTRQRFAQHTSDPACSGCHRLIDGLGFGFEGYDGLGRYRTLDQGLPVDTSGDVVEGQDASGPFVGAVALSQRLAHSDVLRDCVPLQWFRYASGRPAAAADACSVEALRQRFKGSGGDLRDLMVGLTQTDTFFNHRPTTGSASP